MALLAKNIPENNGGCAHLIWVKLNFLCALGQIVIDDTFGGNAGKIALDIGTEDWNASRRKALG